MSLFRLAALVVWVIAAGCAFGWWLHATQNTVLGLVASGLALYVAAELDTSGRLTR